MVNLRAYLKYDWLVVLLEVEREHVGVFQRVSTQTQHVDSLPQELHLCTADLAQLLERRKLTIFLFSSRYFVILAMKNAVFLLFLIINLKFIKFLKVENPSSLYGKWPNCMRYILIMRGEGGGGAVVKIIPSPKAVMVRRRVQDF